MILEMKKRPERSHNLEVVCAPPDATERSLMKACAVPVRYGLQRFDGRYRCVRVCSVELM